MADYSARFHEKKIILKKYKHFVKLRKQNVVCAYEFSGSPKKSYVPLTTFLDFSAFTSGDRAIFGKREFLANLKRKLFCTFSLKTILNKAVHEPRVSPAFAITYLTAIIVILDLKIHQSMWIH